MDVGEARLILDENPEIRERIQALKYVGSDEEQYIALQGVFARAFTKFPEFIPTVLSRLTTEDMEEIIQFEVC